MKLTLCLFVCLIGGAAHSFAINCGDVISSDVTLSADLACNDKHGLIAGASNITIHLNGHTISCSGNGVAGTCQPFPNAVVNQRVGILSAGRSNVKILGPGEIRGFASGIYLEAGTAFVVDGVTVSGPAGSADQLSANVTGISVSNSPCSIANLPGTPAPPPTAVISGNEIQDVAKAVSVTASGCVTVKGNLIHDIKAFDISFGIYLYNANNSRLYLNSVSNVGLNRSNETAIYMSHTSHHNEVYSNIVTHNCGYGVTVSEASHHNNLYSNTVKFNGGQQAGCNAPQKTFFDLFEFSNGTGNTFNANNVCRTQSGQQIPAGVCKPNE